MNQENELSREARAELGETLGRVAREAQRAGAAMDDAIADFLGVNATDARCLDILEQYGRTTAGDLADHMALTTGAVTTMLDRLERAGFVTRERGTDDRRRVYAELTDDARAAIATVFAPFIDVWERHGPLFSDAELRAIYTYLTLSRDLAARYAELVRGLPRPASHDAKSAPPATAGLAEGAAGIVVPLDRGR